MKYYVEEELKNFKAWSGGMDTLNELRKMDKIEEVENYINDCMEGASDIDINDFLWFERDYIFKDILGIEEEESNKIQGGV